MGDLDRAGIPFENDRGRTIDRYALKTTFTSWLGQFGIAPRIQTILSRHVPQGVTLRHYQDFSVFDLWAEIQKLPRLRPRLSRSPTRSVQQERTIGRHLPRKAVYAVVYTKVAGRG